MSSPRTLFDKIWKAHAVADGLIYIDLHLVHEVTSPQAFDGLRLEGRKVRRPDKTVATADHNVPTDGSTVAAQIADHLSRVQVETLERNCEEFGIPIYSIGSARQGIVHVIGPELGVTQPGMTIVCGDSHTATHGAFGALAFGIGTSEVEHVLATQTLRQSKPKSMLVRYDGQLGFGVTPKDLILGTIGQMGTDGAAGHVVEYAGPVIEGLSMEGRMTICNMTIEGGGRAGMIAADDTTFEWVHGRTAAHVVHSHLKMEGAWHLYRPGTKWIRPDYQARAVLETSGWQAVGFDLGTLQVLPRDREHEAVGHLGPDLLGPDWDAEEAVRRLVAQPEAEVITALIEQRNLAEHVSKRRERVRAAEPRSPRGGCVGAGVDEPVVASARGKGRREPQPART